MYDEPLNQICTFYQCRMSFPFMVGNQQGGRPGYFGHLIYCSTPRVKSKPNLYKSVPPCEMVSRTKKWGTERDIKKIRDTYRLAV